MDNYEYTELLKNLTLKMDNITGVVEPDKLQARLDEIEVLENDQDFWNDASNAATIQKEKTQCERKLDKYNIAKEAIVDAKELYEMAKEEEDEDSISECFDGAQELEQQILNMELEVLLSEEMDSNNAILSIHPGAGGTESQDWAEMLLRMYKRWAERRGFKVEVLDYQVGDEAGIKDVSILIKGENAYGYLKVENGIHRLVRISPFDSNAKRHTSFSSVMVSPEVDDNINITLEDKDLRIDTYRSSGAGGQHVNKTESAIRLTHIETGVVVQCQNDRSQHKNKATAMKMMKSRLYELELEAKKAETAGIAKSEIGWGHQIRSYVMQPYQQVKDTRSNEAYSNVTGILDGDIDKMIEGVLISQNRA
ncbi:peptide chain release factor 2 [Sulfurimonas sp.]|nr:peptide chain release factor 2 [Sulfurimonas sp.]